MCRFIQEVPHVDRRDQNPLTFICLLFRRLPCRRRRRSSTRLPCRLFPFPLLLPLLPLHLLPPPLPVCLLVQFSDISLVLLKLLGGGLRLLLPLLLERARFASEFAVPVVAVPRVWRNGTEEEPDKSSPGMRFAKEGWQGPLDNCC